MSGMKDIIEDEVTKAFDAEGKAEIENKQCNL